MMRASAAPLVARFAAVAATIACLCAPACFLNPYRDLTDVDDRVRSPSASDCAGCHVEIAAEFFASEHAASFDDPAFVAATSQRTFTDCLGCHAPVSVYTPGIPELRTQHREEGVTCIACHFDGDVLAGPAPRSALVDPHPVAAERPLYRSSELCAKCHEGTAVEWRGAAEPKRTCQECHMKAVTRKLTQATDRFSAVLVSFEDPFEGRSHSFQVDAIAGIEDAFDARITGVSPAANGASSVRVRIDNKTPHDVPTGDFGSRRVSIDLVVLGAGDAALSRRTVDLLSADGSELKVGESRDFDVEAPPGARAVDVTLRALPRSGADVTIHTFRIALP